MRPYKNWLYDFMQSYLSPTLAGEEALIRRYSSGIEMDAGRRPLIGFREGDQGRRGAWALISAAKRDLRLLRWRL